MKSRVRSVVRASDVIVAMVALIAVLLAACSGETTEEPDVVTTTTVVESAASSGSDDVEFGRGLLPATVPADFPIPDQAVIGSTMIDRNRDLTEAVVVYPSDVPEVVRYYETNLPELGYTIEESAGTDANWTIDFSNGDSTGELRLSVGGGSLTQGILRVVTPASG